MKKYVSIFFAFLAVLAAPFAAMAHPGHGEHGGFTITHYFTEPEHIALLALIIAAIVYYVARGRKRTSEK